MKPFAELPLAQLILIMARQESSVVSTSSACEQYLVKSTTAGVVS
jgi:hypothetical protein